MPAPTQREVARRAGVSVATVSYVLSGRPGRARPATDEVRDRVLRAAHELGYERNHAARSLRRQRTELACVVYRPPGNPWVDALTEQLHATATARGYAVISLPIGPGDRAESALRLLRERYVDGAMLTPDHCIEPTEIRRLAKGGLPLVVFDDDITPRRFDTVRMRQAAACYAAVQHLVERGHRRIAHLANAEELRQPGHGVRFASYRRVLADRGIPMDMSLVVSAADSRERAYAETTTLLQRSDRPTAVFSATDRAAVDAIWAARDLGFAVPDDVAVVGVGNILEGMAIRPALTTVGVRSADFAMPIERLWSRIDGEVGPGQQLEQPWELILRESA
jgi:LacI family transcriptional regulator